MAKHGVLKQQDKGGDRHCHPCIERDKQQRDQKQQPDKGPGDVDDLNPRNIRAQSWNDAENANR